MKFKLLNMAFSSIHSFSIHLLSIRVPTHYWVFHFVSLSICKTLFILTFSHSPTLPTTLSSGRLTYVQFLKYATISHVLVSFQKFLLSRILFLPQPLDYIGLIFQSLTQATISLSIFHHSIPYLGLVTTF